MGYACPVCAAPQRDAEHLADHLAFTAMLHGGAHGDWLDEHAPGWADEGPAALGERVAPLADEAIHETVFEDTAHDHDHGTGRPFGDGEEPTDPDGRGGSDAPGRPGGPVGSGRSGHGGALDETTRAALAEAREMTRRMRGEGTEGADDGGERDDGDGGDDRTGDDDRGGTDDPDDAAESDGIGSADGDADADEKA